MAQAQTGNRETPGQTPWTRDLARDLFPGRTTPFGWTLLRAPAENAMRQMWAAFGVTDIPQASFWQYGDDGFVRLNASNLEIVSRASHGAAWLGAVRGEAPTGFAARLRPPGVIRQAGAEIQAAQTAAAALNTRLFDWHRRVRSLRWTQADLLQVMEELEPNAQAALQSYFTLRAGLNAAHAHLEDMTAGTSGALAGLTGLPSVDAVYALADASEPTRAEFLARYGHRGLRDVTPAARRWRSHPDALSDISAATSRGDVALAAAAGQSAEETLYRSLDGGRRRDVEAALRAVRDLFRAADRAWDGITLVMATAQSWIAAAAAEAAGAGLIQDRADVLLLELEELKQVATGEWHGGKRDAVLEQVERRRAQLVGLPEPLSPASPRATGGGQAEGVILRAESSDPVAAQPGSILVTQNPDAGWTDHWLTAAGLISAAADPCSPGMIVARALGLPTIIGAAEFVEQAGAGDMVRMDGNTGQIIPL